MARAVALERLSVFIFYSPHCFAVCKVGPGISLTEKPTVTGWG
jgi:hypothetical protein